MAFPKIFQKKEEPKRGEHKKTKEPGKKKAARSTVSTEKKDVAPAVTTKEGVRAQAKALRAFEHPHITEKAVALTGMNQYVFRVSPSTTKQEVREVVEGMYGVDVTNVQMITVRPKNVRLGRNRGIRSGYKKAVVRLKNGQSLDILPT